MFSNASNLLGQLSVRPRRQFQEAVSRGRRVFVVWRLRHKMEVFVRKRREILVASSFGHPHCIILYPLVVVIFKTLKTSGPQTGFGNLTCSMHVPISMWRQHQGLVCGVGL